jgi:hypothetical protein
LDLPKNGSHNTASNRWLNSLYDRLPNVTRTRTDLRLQKYAEIKLYLEAYPPFLGIQGIIPAYQLFRGVKATAFLGPSAPWGTHFLLLEMSTESSSSVLKPSHSKRRRPVQTSGLALAILSFQTLGMPLPYGVSQH